MSATAVYALLAALPPEPEPPALCLRCQVAPAGTALYCPACKPFAPKHTSGPQDHPEAGRYLCPQCQAAHRLVGAPDQLCAVCDGPRRRAHAAWHEAPAQRRATHGPIFQIGTPSPDFHRRKVDER